MAQLLANMNTAVLQMPLGFIRIIEIPMTILAFASTSGYSAQGSVKLPDGCKTPPTYMIEFDYPFDMAGRELPVNFCDSGAKGEQFTLFSESFSSSAQFFVFTGVVSFLYILAILAIYLLYWPNYENDARFANADFLVTALLGLFWFIGSCAWASGVRGLKSVTDSSSLKDIIAKVPPCNKTSCELDASWNYASLNVSLIAGFTCAALWLSNLWFIYKETAWFKARAAGQPGAASGAGVPQQPGSSSTGSTTQPAYR